MNLCLTLKKQLISQVDGPDTRVTFETFLPMLQDVSSKPIRDTVDDFVEGLKHFDKVRLTVIYICHPVHQFTDTDIFMDILRGTIDGMHRPFT